MARRFSYFLVGSLAYDSIMDFPGKFSDHILPEKVHVLSVSFMVRTLRVNYGGTVGNIAFGLSSLGIRPSILASAGSDFAPYGRWLRAQGVETKSIHLVRQDRTAAAYIMTDRADNQIAGFYPGAMRTRYPRSLRQTVGKTPAPFLVVSAGNLQDMIRLADDARRLGIPYLFDPGQQLPNYSKAVLRRLLLNATGCSVNDYERSLIEQRTGMRVPAILRHVPFFITTYGPRGSLLEMRSRRFRVPAVRPRRVVDPTGAGDAYRAGLLAALGKGYDLATAVRCASTMATYAVEQYGTQTYHVTWAGLVSRYKKVFGALPKTVNSKFEIRNTKEVTNNKF